MNIFVLLSPPLISEMLVILIKRMHSNSNIYNTNSFDGLLNLLDKHKSADIIFIDPYAYDCTGHDCLIHLSKILPSTNIINVIDIKKNSLTDIESNDAPFFYINKNDSIHKINSSLKKIINIDVNKLANIKITKRHQQIIFMLNQGFSNKRIAEELSIKEQTVKVHLYRLYKTMNVNSRLTALNLARDRGWV